MFTKLQINTGPEAYVFKDLRYQNIYVSTYLRHVCRLFLFVGSSKSIGFLSSLLQEIETKLPLG